MRIMNLVAVATGLLLAACPSPTKDSGETETDAVDTDESADTDTGETGDSKLEGLEIAGTWADDWGGSHEISDASWTMAYPSDTSIFHIALFDNEVEYLVAQNDSANAWSPDLWSRIDWTWVGDEPWYCQVAYDEATQDDAAAVEPPDRSDPANSGCGGFSWNRLIAE